jgi:hypothetical protein
MAHAHLLGRAHSRPHLHIQSCAFSIMFGRLGRCRRCPRTHPRVHTRARRVCWSTCERTQSICARAGYGDDDSNDDGRASRAASGTGLLGLAASASGGAQKSGRDGVGGGGDREPGAGSFALRLHATASLSELEGGAAICAACADAIRTVGPEHGCTTTCVAGCPQLAHAQGCAPESANLVCYQCRSACSLLGCARALERRASNSARANHKTSRCALTATRTPRAAPPRLQDRHPADQAHVLQGRVHQRMPCDHGLVRLPGRTARHGRTARAPLWCRAERLWGRRDRRLLRGLSVRVQRIGGIRRLLLAAVRRAMRGGVAASRAPLAVLRKTRSLGCAC